MKLKELRNKVNMTQEKLAEQIYVPVATVRKWERGRAIPSFSYMEGIANALKVELKDVIDAFAPEQTEQDDFIASAKKINICLEEIFYDSSDIDAFFHLMSLFEMSTRKGLITHDDEGFMFTRVICGEPKMAYALIFRDDNFNRVVLTKNNMIKVTPISFKNGIFIFDIIVNIPMFHISEDYNPKAFEQLIRITIFD